MKAVITSCILLLTISFVVTIHSQAITALTKSVIEQADRINSLAESDNWAEVVKEIDNIQNLLKKNRIWSAMTISARNLEETETALNKSRTYAVLSQKPDFFGEFILFQDLIKRISARESLSLDELL